MGYREYLVALFVSVVIASFLAIFFWRRRPAPGATVLASLSGAILMWEIGYILETLATTLSGFRLANAVEYIGFVNIPVLWFIFTNQYTGNHNWLTRTGSFSLLFPV